MDVPMCYNRFVQSLLFLRLRITNNEWGLLSSLLDSSPTSVNQEPKEMILPATPCIVLDDLSEKSLCITRTCIVHMACNTVSNAIPLPEPVLKR